jgi:nanoRNase/pAp phosphatase (c-di-AMP/oligoRNAs hydrolase)
MIYVLVSDDSLFHRMVAETFLQDEVVWSWAGRRKNGDVWAGSGTPFYGDLDDAETYGVLEGVRAATALVCLKEQARTAQAVDALSRRLPGVKVLVTTVNGELDHLVRDNLRKVSWADMVGDRLLAEISRLRTLEKVQQVREVLDPAENVALLVQPDPDPDALASALALRQVLRRNRATAPIVTFAPVTRPENVAMLRLLEIELEVIQPADLERFDRIALLDVQQNVMQALPRDPDVIIDHHPEQKGYGARFRDIRASYGATSTILTEYCLAAEVPVHQRLATALLYGIKSDTLFLDRETSQADIVAFAYLYPLVNTNLLRRIEKPELPKSAFSAFARALRGLDLTSGLAYVHLGRVVREDVIPQMAELCLQLEGAEWSAASGIVGETLVVSVRNAGYLRAAGSVVKAVFGDIGSAGGHQAMAKAVIPLEAFRRKYGSTRVSRIKDVMTRGFLGEIECSSAARR